MSLLLKIEKKINELGYEIDNLDQEIYKEKDSTKMDVMKVKRLQLVAQYRLLRELLK